MRRSLLKGFLLAVSAFSFVLAVSIPAAMAGPPAAAPSAQASSSPASAPALDRKKSLSFDNDVVEGMNGTNLDSAENIGAEDGGGQRLYHKRKNFNKEMPVLIHEMGYSE